jgi:demethoxyubiquinone hydroxylase (CLK1/Coq7/Cat5 family)
MANGQSQMPGNSGKSGSSGKSGRSGAKAKLISAQDAGISTLSDSAGTNNKNKKDAMLCHDALATEKYASALYNTGIFEFKDTNIRQTLNHIQKEEQEHGEQIYNYMAGHGYYSASN